MTDADCISAPDDRSPTIVFHWISTLFGVRRLNTAMVGRVTEQTGLPESSFQVLCFLLHQPGHSAPMSHLARHLEFSTAGITKVTDRLTQSGLLERQPCPADRRVVYAVLSTDGVQAARRAECVLEDVIRDVVVSHVGEVDFARLAEIVAKARTGLHAPA